MSMVKKAVASCGKGGPGFPSIGSIAKGVSNTVGAGPLTDYLGSKIAKMRAPSDQKKYVEDKTSGKDALKSAGALAITVSPLGAAVGAMRAVKGAVKASGLADKAARAKSAITGPTNLPTSSAMKGFFKKSPMRPFSEKYPGPFIKKRSGK